MSDLSSEFGRLTVQDSSDLGFPFLDDEACTEVIKRGRVMFILRGIPGSGKSTISSRLQQVYETDCVCSADHYFIKDGVYRYDKDKIKLAHESSQNKARISCEQGVNVVIIDNTNTKQWEMGVYVRLANSFGYIIIVLIPKGHGSIPVDVLAKRNKHHVPADVILSKLQGFEVVHPYFAGWFLHYESRSKLRELSKQVMQVCWKNVLFPKYINDGYFSMIEKSLHVTACYFGRRESSVMDCTVEKYLRAIGTIATISVIAIVLTKRTIFACVELPEHCEGLYANDPDGKEHVALPKMHAAHITLGCANGVTAAAAKDDAALYRLCELLQEDSKKAGPVLHYTKKDVWAVRLKTPQQYTTLFAGGY